MIAEKEAQQVEQIGDAIVHGRRGHEKHAAADDEAREVPVPIGVGITETMGFVDYEQTVRDGTGERSETHE